MTSNVMCKKNTVIYGIGKRAKRLLDILPEYDSVVLMDSACGKQGEIIGSHEIVSYSENIDRVKNADRICITVSNISAYNEIKNNLQSYNVPFVSYEDLFVEYVKAIIEKCQYSVQPSKKKTVLIAAFNGVSFGGIETWVRELTLDLVKCGFYIRIATMTKESVKHNEIDEYIDLVCNSAEVCFRDQIENIINYYYRNNPSIIITTQPDLFLLCARALKSFANDQLLFNTIATVHGYDMTIMKMYVDLYFKGLKYVGCSEDISNGLLKMGIPTENVLSMKIPFRCEENIKRSYSANQNQPIKIGWAGRIHSLEVTDQKRLDYLILYIKRLKELNIKFVMEIAGDGLAREEFTRRIEEDNLSDMVRMCGYLEQDELQMFWRRQDICILCSDLEGRSISVLEAMGNGAVPIVTDVSGIKEDIVDGYNGFIVNIGDYKELVNKTIYLYKHRELLHVIGKRTHDMIYPKSRKENHVKFWVELIEKTIHRGEA